MYPLFGHVPGRNTVGEKFLKLYRTYKIAPPTPKTPRAKVGF
jgi:hypothetical protein